MTLHSAIYEGRVRHRRFEPVEHAFEYRMFQMYLDLDELDQVFRRRMLWSTRRPALAWFRRADHMGDPDQPLAESVRQLVAEQTGRRPAGPIRLLTHLRYFGYVMNPVSFFYCFDSDDQQVETVVAEVENTPWGERHCYVLAAQHNTEAAPKHRYQFSKDFHVSPFMGMDQDYDWRFRDPGRELFVHMENIQDGKRVFDATLRMTRQPITARALASALTRYPFMTTRVISAIYMQALKLKLKKVPFHAHPKHDTSGVPTSETS